MEAMKRIKKKIAWWLIKDLLTDGVPRIKVKEKIEIGDPAKLLKDGTIVFAPLTSDPSTLEAGKMWFRSDLKEWRYSPDGSNVSTFHTIIAATPDEVAGEFMKQSDNDYLANLLENVFSADYAASVLNSSKITVGKVVDILSSTNITPSKIRAIASSSNISGSRLYDILSNFLSSSYTTYDNFAALIDGGIGKDGFGEDDVASLFNNTDYDASRVGAILASGELSAMETFNILTNTNMSAGRAFNIIKEAAKRGFYDNNQYGPVSSGSLNCYSYTTSSTVKKLFIYVLGTSDTHACDQCGIEWRVVDVNNTSNYLRIRANEYANAYQFVTVQGGSGVDSHSVQGAQCENTHAIALYYERSGGNFYILIDRGGNGSVDYTSKGTFSYFPPAPLRLCRRDEDSGCWTYYKDNTWKEAAMHGTDAPP